MTVTDKESNFFLYNMNIQDYFYGTRKTNLLLPTAISSATDRKSVV